MDNKHWMYIDYYAYTLEVIPARGEVPEGRGSWVLASQGPSIGHYSHCFLGIWKCEPRPCPGLLQISLKPEVSRVSEDWAWNVLLYLEVPPSDFRTPPTGHVVGASLKSQPRPDQCYEQAGCQRLCPPLLGWQGQLQHFSRALGPCAPLPTLCLLGLLHCYLQCGSHPVSFGSGVAPQCLSSIPSQQCPGPSLANLGTCWQWSYYLYHLIPAHKLLCDFRGVKSLSLSPPIYKMGSWPACLLKFLSSKQI